MHASRRWEDASDGSNAGVRIRTPRLVMVSLDQTARINISICSSRIRLCMLTDLVRKPDTDILREHRPAPPEDGNVATFTMQIYNVGLRPTWPCEGTSTVFCLQWIAGGPGHLVGPWTWLNIAFTLSMHGQTQLDGIHSLLINHRVRTSLQVMSAPQTSKKIGIETPELALMDHLVVCRRINRELWRVNSQLSDNEMRCLRLRCELIQWG
jgi:hypothetical protein